MLLVHPAAAGGDWGELRVRAGDLGRPGGEDRRGMVAQFALCRHLARPQRALGRRRPGRRDHEGADAALLRGRHWPQVANSPMAAAVITAVAIHPVSFSGKRSTNSPMAARLLATRMVMAMIG